MGRKWRRRLDDLRLKRERARRRMSQRESKGEDGLTGEVWMAKKTGDEDHGGGSAFPADCSKTRMKPEPRL